jgi:hypothetical protein
MDRDTLLAGYRKIVNTIYSPQHFYARIMTLLKHYEPSQEKVFHFNAGYLRAFGKSIVKLGILGRERMYFWKLVLWTTIRKPRLLSLAVLCAIYGFHFRKISSMH